MVNKSKYSPMTCGKNIRNQLMPKKKFYHHKNFIRKKFHLKAKLTNSLDAKTTKENSNVRISLFNVFLTLLSNFS